MTDTVRWRAVSSRDASFDGTFVYCVKTTRIYCRPVCKARLARRSNVEFHDTAEDAESAGYRACKRCQPQAVSAFQPPEVDKIKKACKLLDDLRENSPLPGLDALAKEAGLSKHHFHRQFKRALNMTPREYALMSRSVSSGTAYQSPASFKTASIHDGIETPHRETWTSDSIDEIYTPDEKLVCYYDAVYTTYGPLLVVFVDRKICKLQLCTDNIEVNCSLEHSFPSETHMHYKLGAIDEEDGGVYRHQIETIIEALERPSGRMLELGAEVII